MAPRPDLLGFFMAGVILLASVTLHEFAHALVATSFGDPTARLAGRLTLNPRPHLDVFGSFAILLLGFGWGKPVPVSRPKLGRGRAGPLAVALAGPTANVLLALISAAAMAIFRPETFGTGGRFLTMAFYLNLLYALFNLLPIPPLDGFPILAEILPAARRGALEFIERWAFLLLLVVGFFLFRPFVEPVVSRLGIVILRVLSL